MERSLKLFQLTLSLTFIVGIYSISIPLYPNEPRCMVVFLTVSDQTLKLDLNFPAIYQSESDEYYLITLLNTESGVETQHTLHEGLYRQELQLEQSIVYRLCFRFITNRHNFPPIMIDYFAHVNYNQISANLKIPPNLLKVDDLSGTYKKAAEIVQKTTQFKQMQKERTAAQDQMFIETNQTNHRLILISILELTVILIAGLYQFFAIRKFLVDKQYL